MALDSIEKAEKLDIEKILVPHYGLLEGDDAKAYLSTAKFNAKDTAQKIAELLKSGASKEEAMAYFKERYYKGYIKEVYPIDAMELNTGITVDLIKREYGI